jgi:peptidase M23-like protein
MRRLLLTCTALLVFAPPAHASWSWPVHGEVITQYRNGADPYAGGQHRGIDIAAAVGTPVVAAADGEVRFAGTAGSSGLTVSVRTADGFDTSYLHLSSFAVRAGARVAAGERLGAVGTSGTRSAVQPHLHFGVREAGTRHAYVDPLSMLPPATAPPPSEAPRPVPAPAPSPLSPGPAPVPEPAPHGVPRPAPAPRFAPRRAPAPRPAPAPRLAPRPAPVPLRAPVPRAAPRPALAPRPAPAPLRAPAPRPAPAPLDAPDPRAIPRSAPAAQSPLAPRAVPAPGPAPGPRLAPLGASPGQARGAAPAGSSGPDFGWALACAGLLLAAGILGLTGDGRTAAARGRSRVRGALRPLVGRH